MCLGLGLVSGFGSKKLHCVLEFLYMYECMYRWGFGFDLDFGLKWFKKLFVAFELPGV